MSKSEALRAYFYRAIVILALSVAIAPSKWAQGCLDDINFGRCLPHSVGVYIRVNDIDSCADLVRSSSLGVYTHLFRDSPLFNSPSEFLEDLSKDSDLAFHAGVIRSAKPSTATFATYENGEDSLWFLEAGPFKSEEYESLIAIVDFWLTSQYRADSVASHISESGKVKYCSFQNLGIVVFFVEKSGRILVCNNKQEGVRLTEFAVDGVGVQRSLASSREFMTIQNRLNGVDDSCIQFFVNPRQLFGKVKIGTRLSPQAYNEVSGLGILDAICVGGCFANAGASRGLIGQVFVPISQPRRGIFDSVSWNPLRSDYEALVPSDSDFVAAYGFDIDSTARAFRLLFGRLFDEAYSDLLLSKHFGISSLHISNSKCFTGTQVAFTVDTSENKVLSVSLARAFEINPADGARDSLREFLLTEFSGTRFDWMKIACGDMWTHEESDWLERKARFEQFASTRDDLKDNLVYPRSTVVLSQKFLYHFLNHGAMAKCCAIDSEQSERTIDSRKDGWYRDGKSRLDAICSDNPVFALFSSHGRWTDFFLASIDDRFGTESDRMRPISTYFDGLNEFPRLSRDQRGAFPNLAIAAWDQGDGFLFGIVEYPMAE